MWNKIYESGNATNNVNRYIDPRTLVALPIREAVGDWSFKSDVAKQQLNIKKRKKHNHEPQNLLFQSTNSSDVFEKSEMTFQKRPQKTHLLSFSE